MYERLYGSNMNARAAIATLNFIYIPDALSLTSTGFEHRVAAYIRSTLQESTRTSIVSLSMPFMQILANESIGAVVPEPLQVAVAAITGTMKHWFPLNGAYSASIALKTGITPPLFMSIHVSTSTGGMEHSLIISTIVGLLDGLTV
jgi:hypothetical protein